MTWTPTFNVPDLTAVIDNLLGYIETNQSDAHLWANGDSPMADYAALYPNATGRLTTRFPQLLVLDQEHKGDEGEGEVLAITLALTLEGAITGSDTDKLVRDTKKYVMALESMLVNIPSGTLCADVINAASACCMNYQTAFDVLRGYGKQAGSWIQIWQTRVEYKFTSSVL